MYISISAIDTANIFLPNLMVKMVDTGNPIGLPITKATNEEKAKVKLIS